MVERWHMIETVNPPTSVTVPDIVVHCRTSLTMEQVLRLMQLFQQMVSVWTITHKQAIFNFGSFWPKATEDVFHPHILSTTPEDTA
jgi:hypothetical protein